MFDLIRAVSAHSSDARRVCTCATVTDVLIQFVARSGRLRVERVINKRFQVAVPWKHSHCKLTTCDIACKCFQKKLTILKSILIKQITCDLNCCWCELVRCWIQRGDTEQDLEEGREQDWQAAEGYEDHMPVSVWLRLNDVCTLPRIVEVLTVVQETMSLALLLAGLCALHGLRLLAVVLDMSMCANLWIEMRSSGRSGDTHRICVTNRIKWNVVRTVRQCNLSPLSGCCCFQLEVWSITLLLAVLQFGWSLTTEAPSTQFLWHYGLLMWWMCVQNVVTVTASPSLRRISCYVPASTSFPRLSHDFVPVEHSDSSLWACLNTSSCHTSLLLLAPIATVHSQFWTHNVRVDLCGFMMHQT